MAYSILFIAPLEPSAAVAVSGLIPRLLKDDPESQFTVVAGEASAPLFEHVPNLARTIIADDYESLPGRLALVAKLHGQAFSLVVDMGGAFVAGWLKHRRKVERPHGPWRENLSLAAARLMGFEADPPEPFLYTTRDIEADADEALAGEAAIMAVGPGAGWVGRQWPGERYGQVAGQLMLAPRSPLLNARIVAFGREEDREAMQSAIFPLPRKRIIQRPYAQDMITDYAWLKRCRLYIGGDNVWTHLAAAAGVPTVGLYGPSDDTVCAPYGDHVRVVRGPRDFETLRKLDPEFSQQMSLMNDLAVEPVLTAARGMITRGKR